jgi:hypothetical protein
VTSSVTSAIELRRQSKPRPVLAVVVLVVITAFLITMSVMLGNVAIREQQLVDELRAHGTTTQGVVTATHARSIKSGTVYDRTVSYLGGRTTSDTVRCVCGAGVGRAEPVVYDRDKPARAMTKTRFDQWSPIAYVGFAAFGASSLVMLITFGRVLRQLRQRRPLDGADVAGG